MDAIKFTIKEAAQQKALDLSKEHKSIFYVIYCHKTEAWYVDNSSFIRLFEELVATYENGKEITE